MFLQSACSNLRTAVLRVMTVILALAPLGWAASVDVSTVSQLTNAVNNGAVGDTITIAAGTYILTAQLTPKAQMTIKGAGIERTILRPAATWTPGTATLIDPINWGGVKTSAYFFYLGNNIGTNSVTISDMTMDGLKQLQGAVCGNTINSLTISNVYFHDFTFCGVRVVGGSQLVIHDCEFINMAISGMDPEAGAVVFAYLSNSDLYNNQFYFTTHGVYYGSGVNAGNFYGFKGRELKQSRIHHNTIMVNFSIELPFDDNYDVEVDHNYLDGWISMPKYAGGSNAPSGTSIRIHHNYDSSAVVAEYPRNDVEIDHNLLDNPRAEQGSMLSGWTNESAPGTTKMHDNLIKNLGRVLADVGLYNNLQFYNNTVNAPQNDGASTNFLFIIDGNITKSLFVCKNNIFDCTGHPRALLWSGLGAGFTAIENNTMINVTDQANYANPSTSAARGARDPLYFICGAPGNQYLVDQWTITPSMPPVVPTAPANLSATASSSSQISLTWADSSSNETGFKLERKTGATGTWSQIATPAANATSFSNLDLTASTEYFYRVRASNAAGNSPFSSEANATTQASGTGVGSGTGTGTATGTSTGSGSSDGDSSSGRCGLGGGLAVLTGALLLRLSKRDRYTAALNSSQN